MHHKQQYMHHSHHNNRTHNIGYYDNLDKQTRDYHRTTNTTQTHRPSNKSERNLIILQVIINGLRNKLEELKTSSHFRKPGSPLKPKHQKYITSQQCAPIGCTRQEVGPLHSLVLQQTYLRLDNCRLLPEDIVCKTTQINNIRRANPCDPAIKLLNEEITSDIQKHKQNIWKEHLDAHWDHRHNTHTLWKTKHGQSNRAPPHTLNTSITFNNKIATTLKHIANYFTKQFTNTVKHATHKTNRLINRATHNIQGYNITLTTSQVQ